jgi:hypothetical protein
MWCIPKLTPEFKKRMENILDLYEESYDPKRPVVCFDEKAKQLLAEVRQPRPAKPGRPMQRDYEYKRCGTCCALVAVEPKGGKRLVQVRKRRTAKDYAWCLKHLERQYPHAKIIRLVQDNLNTHCEKSLTETFGEQEGKELFKRFEFHFTPKHASWLNMAELEIGVLEGQCLNRRISTMEKMRKEVRAWEKRRNKQKKGIKWGFTKEKAQKTFPELYE